VMDREIIVLQSSADRQTVDMTIHLGWSVVTCDDSDCQSAAMSDLVFSVHRRDSVVY